MKPSLPLEILEARIAPAAVFHLIDVDGDLVTIQTSKGFKNDLSAVVSLGPVNGFGGQSINVINLGTNPVFDGTDLIVKARPGPNGGDGFVNVATIGASGLDLGTVTIDGGLTGGVAAGKGTAASFVKAINAHAISGVHVWTIDAKVGSLHVATDLIEEEIHINGAGGLRSLTVGGSLIGSVATKTGFISVPNGKIGAVKIGGNLEGGTGTMSGELSALRFGAITIGGALLGATSDPGGSHSQTGLIDSLGKIGAVKIGGDVRGGVLANSGKITAVDTIASLQIGGSLLGGGKVNSGYIDANAGIPGTVRIVQDVIGGDGSNSGLLFLQGNVRSVFIGGSLKGGTNSFSGMVDAASSSVNVTVGSITVKGEVIGGTFKNSGCIDVIGSEFGDVRKIKIGKSMTTGPATFSGIIFVQGNIGSVSIGEDLVGTASFPAEILASGHSSAANKPEIALKSLTVHGRVERALINAGHFTTSDPFFNGDAQIGRVKIGGDWIASNMVAGAKNLGADGMDATGDDNLNFGDSHDAADSGGVSTLFSKIAKIIIGGSVVGTVGGTDHFGFVSQEIGLVKIGGVAVPLAPGRSNDTSTTNPSFAIGTTGDVSVHEVA
ncbi:MAG: hypothetical protein QOD99_1910 [Chthoniobacter sp.]|jgi:hypothetical protein|nr:hypothetical protein [Chthoniobacter sp.]